MKLFPFELVKKNTNVILWGFNPLAQSFYQQMSSKSYCKLVLWIDPRFDLSDMEMKKPFGVAGDIDSVSYDYIVIATENRKDAALSIEKLESMGISRECIIWNDYSVNEVSFPVDYRMLFSNPEDYLYMIKEYNQASIMVDGHFYQSLPQLGIQGVRDSFERIYTYGLDKVFDSNMRVLDIGCNTGFFDLCFADRVKSINAIDIDNHYINVADTARKMLQISNVTFEKCDIKQKQFDEKFELVIACAVHNWIGFTLDKFVELINNILNDKGYFLLESNSIEMVDKNFDQWLNGFTSLGYKVVHKSRTVSKIGIREAVLFEK